MYSLIVGLHCNHVGGQNKRKFAHIVCIKMEVNTQRRKILLFLSTNMAAMTSHAIHQYNASINVKPEGGGPRAYVGHLTSSAFSTLGNLTKNLGPRVGKFAFFVRRNGTKSHHPMCLFSVVQLNMLDFSFLLD